MHERFEHESKLTYIKARRWLYDMCCASLSEVLAQGGEIVSARWFAGSRGSMPWLNRPFNTYRFTALARICTKGNLLIA